MGLDTLVNGVKAQNGRRGDLALIVAAILAGFKLYESLVPAAQASESTAMQQLQRDFNEFKTDISSRVAVLESKTKK